MTRIKKIPKGFVFCDGITSNIDVVGRFLTVILVFGGFWVIYKIFGLYYEIKQFKKDQDDTK